MLLATAMLLGAVPESVDAQAPATDYSKGFELLRRAGLPDVKDWKYVDFQDPYGEHQTEMLRQALQIKKPTGNGWLEPQVGSNGLQRLVSSAGQMLAVSGKEDQSSSTKELKEAQAMGLSYRPGLWKDADEKADAAELAEKVTKTLADSNARSAVMQQGENVAILFFAAAHLHRRGFEKEGNQIVTALLQGLPRKEALIELAVDTLGDIRFASAVSRFNADRDWKTLQASLESLLSDFPEFWRARPLAERLLAQVKPRVGGAPPPPVPPGAFALTEEQKAWWQKITEEPVKPGAEKEEEEYDTGDAEGTTWAHLWILHRLDLPEQLKEQWNRGNMAGRMGPFDPGKDWEWITVMAAALGDETITALSRPDRFGGFGMSYSFFDVEQPPAELSAEELQERWSRMNPPVTRDSLARAFLGTALPIPDEMGGSYGVDRISVEDLRDLAKSWSARIAGKRGVELARIYLKEGSDEHRRVAAALLAHHGNEPDLSLLEEMVLESPQEHMGIARQILHKRKGAGKPFLEKFRTRLTDQWKESNGGSEPGAKFPEHLNGELQALDMLVSGKGLKELVIDYASGKSNESTLAALVEAHGRDSSWEQSEIEQVLVAIITVPKEEGRRAYTLLAVAGQMLNATLANVATPPEWVLQAFKPVIAYGRDVEVADWSGMKTRLSRTSCMVLDSLWKDGGAATFYEKLYRQLPPEDFGQFMEARAMARLEGKEPPPFPDSARVPDARKEELKEGLKKLADGSWNEFHAGLSLDEKLVAHDLLQKAEADNSWKNQTLKITEVVLGDAIAARGDRWKSLQGRATDAALAKLLLESCQDAASVGKNAEGNLSARSLYRGMRLGMGEITAEMRQQSRLQMWLDSLDGSGTPPAFSAVAYVAWNHRSGERGSITSFRGKDGKWSPPAEHLPTVGPSPVPIEAPLTAEEFDKRFTAFLSGLLPSDQNWHLTFGVFHMPAPKTNPQ
jgi:hypothetical protein